MRTWIKSLAKVNIKAVGEIIDLAAENKEMRKKLAKGQESFELVLDNAVYDKAIIADLRKKCNPEQINEAYAATIERQAVEISKLKQKVNKLEQHKQSNEDV